ncbi:MAG TPA: hypothetical protein VI791_01035 [Patescibacteria group bacterium]|nr:hypothetical protein [Patescibacteria group bacterium]
MAKVFLNGRSATDKRVVKVALVYGLGSGCDKNRKERVAGVCPKNSFVANFIYENPKI